MLLVLGDRQTGKTTALIDMAHKEGGYIVCRSKMMCGEIANMARKMQRNIAFPLTYDEFLQKRYYGKGISKFYIDDAEVLLQSLTEVPIVAISMGGERKKVEFHDGR